MTLQRTMHPTPLPSSCIVAGAVFTELFSPQQKAHQKSLVYLLKGYHRNRAENTLHCVRSCVCFLGMYILLKRKSMNRTLGEYEELEDCVCSQTCTTSGAILFCRICSVRVSAPPYLSGWALDSTGLDTLTAWVGRQGLHHLPWSCTRKHAQSGKCNRR